MKFSVFLAGLLVAISALAQQADLPVQVTIHREELKPAFVKESGDYKLFIYFTAKGTRSEGVIGLLKFKDQEVLGKTQGEKISTPFGAYVWHGPTKERKQLWGPRDGCPKTFQQSIPAGRRRKNRLST